MIFQRHYHLYNRTQSSLLSFACAALVMGACHGADVKIDTSHAARHGARRRPGGSTGMSAGRALSDDVSTPANAAGWPRRCAMDRQKRRHTSRLFRRCADFHDVAAAMASISRARAPQAAE